MFSTNASKGSDRASRVSAASSSAESLAAVARYGVTVSFGLVHLPSNGLPS